MRSSTSSSTLARVVISVLFCALLLPRSAQGSTIGSVGVLYQLALVFAILCTLLLGTSLLLIRRFGWTLRKDWWRLGLLLFAAFFGALVFAIPLTEMIFG